MSKKAAEDSKSKAKVKEEKGGGGHSAVGARHSKSEGSVLQVKAAIVEQKGESEDKKGERKGSRDGNHEPAAGITPGKRARVIPAKFADSEYEITPAVKSQKVATPPTPQSAAKLSATTSSSVKKPAAAGTAKIKDEEQSPSGGKGDENVKEEKEQIKVYPLPAKNKAKSGTTPTVTPKSSPPAVKASGSSSSVQKVQVKSSAALPVQAKSTPGGAKTKGKAAAVAKSAVPVVKPTIQHAKVMLTAVTVSPTVVLTETKLSSQQATKPVTVVSVASPVSIPQIIVIKPLEELMVDQSRPTPAPASPKPTKVSSGGAVNQAKVSSGGAVNQAKENVKQTSKPDSAVKVKAKAVPQKVTDAGEDDDKTILYDCPIDEYNVDDVLDQSIDATTTMRQLLCSFKEDLKRMGGTPSAGPPEHKTVHSVRRQEIAAKLAEAFVQYQSMIDTIGDFAKLPPLDFSSGAWSIKEVSGTKRKRAAAATPGVPRTAPPVKRASTGVVKPSGVSQTAAAGTTAKSPLQIIRSESAVTPVGVKKVKQQPKSVSKPLAPVVQNNEPPRPKTVRVHATSMAVSDDLWMSCEPGSDDEESHGKRKHKV